MTNDRKWVLVAVLVLILLPLALVLIEARTYYVANRPNGTIVSSGETRDYVLYVPRSYDRATPAPLVISLHGAGLWGAAHSEVSQWNEVAEREGLIVVYPSGHGRNGPRVWRAGNGGDDRRDVTFISDLIDKLEGTYNIDPARIYANGLSNGGGMSFVLSCTLPDRIAAVGLVAAAHFLPMSRCPDPRPVPMISFHGTADRFTAYNGGTSWVARNHLFPNIPAFTADWAQKNRCGPDPVESAVADDVTRLEYTHCADDAAVVLYTIRNGGHTWPGGGPLPEWFVGPASTAIDATSVMWQFFNEHPLGRLPIEAR
jgi:polyhydroxybutyrate depolymerase